MELFQKNETERLGNTNLEVIHIVTITLTTMGVMIQKIIMKEKFMFLLRNPILEKSGPLEILKFIPLELREGAKGGVHFLRMAKFSCLPRGLKI